MTVDAIVASDPRYQAALENERMLRRRAGEYKQMLMTVCAGLRRLNRELFSRARERGYHAVLGLAHHLRTHKARRLCHPAGAVVSPMEFGR